VKTGAAEGSEQKTACLLLTTTRNMEAAILNLSTSSPGFSLGLLTSGSAHHSQSIATAAADI
jgi:hypothetical protein